jgi:SulP family sulfate permease
VAVLRRRPDLHVVAVADLDRALQLAEEMVLADTMGWSAADRPTVSIDRMLADVLHDPAAVDALMPHLRRIHAETGAVLIHQGDPLPGLYFLEQGRLTAWLDHGPTGRRLRTMLPGTVVGEISLYLGSVPTASVVAEEPSVLWLLDAAEFERIGRDDPGAAAALHRFAAQVLAERVTHAEKAVRVLRD